ncbi:MAG: AAA family ATPase, partial [Erysipelotrichales bacterium]
MLKQINISNFAIIEKASIDFDSNLTVITGQTGAGKSIVIDAIEQLLGARASSSMVSYKEDSAFIEGVFEYNDTIEQLLNKHDIDLEDEYLFITKRIKKDGKSQLKINDRIVRNDLVKQVGLHLVEIHSQHATYLLNEQVNQQKFIDNFFNTKEQEVFNEYKELYKQHTKSLQELEDFNNNVVDPELLSFYKDQLKDIEDNLIDEDKVEELTNKEKYYQEFEKISTHITSILAYFNNGLKENINDISIQLDKLSDVNEQYSKISEKANDIYYDLDDLHQQINEEYSNLNFDDYEYDLIKEQLFNYNKMIKKYSYSHEEVNNKIDDLNNKIDYINNSSSIILKLENKIKEEEQELKEKAKELDVFRLKYIKEITSKVNIHLKDL